MTIPSFSCLPCGSPSSVRLHYIIFKWLIQRKHFFKKKLGLNALDPLFSLHLSIFNCFRNDILSVHKRNKIVHIFN